jgi:hypothetical protein
VSTLQNHAEALLEKIDQRERTGGKLQPEDRALILRLAAKGNLSQEEIAKAVGCSQPTVSRVLALLDTRKEARTILESGAARMATNVVDNGDPDLHLKALAKLDVVREDREGAGVNVGPIVIIGAPAQQFDGFRTGDVIVSNGGDELRVFRDNGGGRGTHFNVPPTSGWSDLPIGVSITEDAQAQLQRRGLPCNAPLTRLPERQAIVVGMPGAPVRCPTTLDANLLNKVIEDGNGRDAA